MDDQLIAPFRSREQHTLGEKMLSDTRFGFGGHVEGNQPIDPEPKPKNVHRHPSGQCAVQQ
jgi:6-phosphogluconate dehydrogenase